MSKYAPYFERGRDSTMCKLCEKTLKRQKDSCTNGMRFHMKKHHIDEYEKMKMEQEVGFIDEGRTEQNYKRTAVANSHVEAKKSKLANKRHSNGSVERSSTQWMEEGESEIDRCVAQMICAEALPFSFVEKPGFRNLLQHLQPNYNLKSRSWTSRRAIPKLYDEYVERLSAKIREAEHVSITTQAWSQNTHSLLSVRVHFLDPKTLKPQFYVAGVLPIEGSPKEDDMVGLLSACLRNLELSTDKIFMMVKDGATSMLNTSDVLNIDSGHCLGPLLQVAIEEGIAALGCCKQLFEKLKAIVRVIRMSDVSGSLKEKESIKGLLNEYELPERVLTFTEIPWTSLYDMMHRFLQDRLAAGLFLIGHPTCPSLTTSDWSVVAKIVELLAPLKEATNFVRSGDSAPISVVLPLLRVLKQELSTSSGCEGVDRVKKAVEDGLKRESTLFPSQFHRKLIIATMVDPRFKDAFFEQSESGAFIDYRGVLLKEAENLALAMSKPTESSDKTCEGDSSHVTIDVFSRFLDQEPSTLVAIPSPATEDDKNRARAEVEEYFSTAANPKINPYEYWSSQSVCIRFPLLRRIAVKHLCAPAMSAESERFSSSGLTLSELHSQFSPEMLEKILFLHGNIPLLGFERV